MVPHITDAIKNWIESVSVIPVDGKEGPPDVCVIELGGTVGESFLMHINVLPHGLILLIESPADNLLTF